MADAENDYVVFEDAEGNEVSNDPRWKAEKTLSNSGVDVAALRARIAELEGQIASGATSPAATMQASANLNNGDADDNDDEEEEYDLDDDGNRTYEELKGKELKSLANQRGVDISGMTKVGEVRAALVEADKAAAE